MAQLGEGLNITGSFNLIGTTENTSSAGYLWFDGTNFKYSTEGPVSTWSSAGNLNNGRFEPAGFGIANAAVLAGGGSPSQNCSELFDGTSWSNGPNYPGIGKCKFDGTGTQNDGIIIDGWANGWRNNTEEFNGTSWASGGTVNVCGYGGSALGPSSTAAIRASGESPNPIRVSTCTEEYNGSTWSTGAALSYAGQYATATGTMNAGLFAGGRNLPVYNQNCSSTYDGTSWSAGGTMITGRYRLTSGGTSNSSFVAGGICTGPPVADTCTDTVELFDGTAWSSGNSLPVGAAKGGGGGTSTSGFIAGGGVTPANACNTSYIGIGGITACTL